jgi:hypothetical protein
VRGISNRLETAKKPTVRQNGEGRTKERKGEKSKREKKHKKREIRVNILSVFPSFDAQFV